MIILCFLSFSEAGLYILFLGVHICSTLAFMFESVWNVYLSQQFWLTRRAWICSVPNVVSQLDADTHQNVFPGCFSFRLHSAVVFTEFWLHLTKILIERDSFDFFRVWPEWWHKYAPSQNCFEEDSWQCMSFCNTFFNLMFAYIWIPS